METVALLTHPACALHETTPGHPERSGRLDAVLQRLAETGLAARLRPVEPPRVTREQLLRVHDAAYVDAVEAHAGRRGIVHLDPDTPIGPHSVEAAERAAGAAVRAVDLVLGGEAAAAFCAVRPPGHHAERARAMGFCLFNNVAVAAAHARAAHGIERVAIVDFDVHHGNGTEQIFEHAPDVLLCSAFQHPFYPGTGADTRRENVANLPLPAGTDGPTWRRAVERAFFPRLETFRPGLVLFSAGFDGHAADPLAGWRLLEDDFAWITREVLRVTADAAGGRVVSTLEGGYDLPALGRSAAAHVEALLG